MKTLKNILVLMGIICPFIIIYILLQPVDDTNIKLLENKCDSLQTKITENSKKIDSITNETNQLMDRSKKLTFELSKLNQKSKELKKQHEKDIAHINSLSNNDVATTFADEFKDID